MAITRIRLDNQAQDATLTPEKISTVVTDDFSFPNDVTAANDLIATTQVQSDKLTGRTGNLVIQPFADTTTGIKLTKANGTTVVLDVDTTNGRIGIGTSAPTQALDIPGASLRVGSTNFTDGHGIRTAGIYDFAGTQCADLQDKYLLGASTFTVAWGAELLAHNSGGWSVKWGDNNVGGVTTRILIAPSGTASLDWTNRLMGDATGTNGNYNIGSGVGQAKLALDWANRITYGTDGATASLDWANRTLKDSAGTTLLDWATPGNVVITGSERVTTALRTPIINRDFDNTQAINVDVRGLTTSGLQNSLSWENRQLFASGGKSLDWEAYTLTRGAGGTVMLNWATAGVIDVNGNRITGMGDPTSAQDAVTKFYVDSVAAGLVPKGASRAATIAVLPAVTYNNGAAGVGATLTANANGVIPAQDGVTLVNADRLLVKNQASALQNGIYVVTDIGSAGTPFILTRATDFDGSPANEVEGGSFTFVTSGTTLASTGWSVVWSGAVVIGTDPITFTQTSAAGIFVAGNGIDITGNTISAKVDGITIDFATSQLEVKAGGISNTQINAAAGIVYSKLNLTGSILNADINTSAGIVYSKLNLTGGIVNADVNAAAAIAYTKLTASGSDRDLQFNSGGIPGSSTKLKYTEGAVNNLIIGYGLSNAVQLSSDNSSGDAALDTGSSGFHISTNGGTWDFVGGVLTTPGAIDLDTHQIHNVVDPSSAQDAATKAYVDALIEAHTVTREVPSGTIDGSNDTFTLAFTPVVGSETVFLNGLLQNEGSGNDYTISGDTIVFEPLAIPETGSTLLVCYRK